MIKSYRDAKLHDVYCLVRLDINVSFKDGKIVDNARLVQAAESLKLLRQTGAKLLILSHLGRPKGQRKAEFSVQPLAAELADLLGCNVGFVADPFTESLPVMQAGDVTLLENIRFWAGEEANDADFAQQLAGLAGCYINDAFSVSHRAHASTAGVADYIPAYAGPALLREVEALEQVLNNPNRPTVGIVGGSKISTKIGVIEQLIPKLDQLIIGGAMANTFLYADGINVGKSLCETDALDIITNIRAKAEECGCTLILPQDLYVAKGLNDSESAHYVALTDCPDDQMILDVGPKTIQYMQNILADARTVLWNGPLGAFEYAPFDEGTNKVAQFVASQTQLGACLSVAGGGDTLAALRHANAADKFSYVSTAGGAFLEWLEGKTLPGIAIVQTN